MCRLGYALRYVLYRQREKNGAAVAPGHGTTSPGIGMLTASCVHSFHFLLLCNCMYGGQLPFGSMSRIVLFYYITFRAFCQCFFALPLSVGACAALLPMHLYRWLQLCFLSLRCAAEILLKFCVFFEKFLPKSPSGYCIFKDNVI